MKRTICMLLVLALITGMMPINVWAEETETSENMSTTTSVEGIESVEQSDESTTSTETQETESVPVDTSVEVTELAEQSEETTVSEETGSYPVINADETTTVEISTGGEYAYFSFTPTYTESYTFYSTGSYDTYGYLYDSDMSQLAYNDDGGESSNYSITYTLEAGVTYIWAARFYGSSKTGSFDVMLQTNHSGEGVVTNSNSCTEDGLMTYTCAVCGEVYTEIIPAAGHTWESEVITPNSCTEEGLMTYTCSVCEETYTEPIPSSHTWNDDRVCSVCGALFYDSGSCGNDLTWSLDNLGTLTISGSGSMTAYSSDSEAPWYEYREIITELIISNNVTNLSRYGFRYFEKLEKIYFNATAMNDLAYSGIFYRTGSDSPGVTVVIGANVTRIPSNLFSNGSYSPDWDASWNCNGVTSVIFEEGSKCETIGNNAFSYCYSLNSIAIPESVTSIGNYAFFNCQNLLIQIEASALPETLGSYWDHGAAICMNVVKFGVTDYGQDYWITGDNTAHVWKYRGDDTTVVIPETIEGVPVVEIATSAFATIIRPHLDPNGKITYVEIPDSVTTINSFAFDSCVGLEKIIIPESVEYIGESAFYYCKNATEIRFNAIAMDNLESDNDVFSRVGENIDGITVTIGSNVTQIPDYLFYESNSDNAPNLTAVVFEEGSVCESIGIHAFHHCDTLSQITLPESITIIGESAFYNCTGLTQIQIPENVKTVGQYAFHNCTGLSSIYYNATAMEDLSGYTAYPDAFAYAGTNGNGIVVTIGENVTYIPGNLFKSPASRCAQITEVVFEDGSQCTGIGTGAFYGCAYLTNISIPENVRNFGSSVFAECSGLSSAGPVGNGYNIEFSWNYSIPANTFSFSNLTEITLPDSISSIGSYAFAYCKGLSGIDLPTELIAIGEMSFIGCSGLLGISIPEKVETIDDEAFKDCSALTEIVFNAVSMNDLTSYNEIFYNAGKNGAGIAVSIGASCSKLPAYLFNPYSSSYAPNITSVVFDKNSNCRIIGRNAFAYLSLVTEIEIPTSVTSIGTYAFRNCTALANITIPESVTSIDENVFYSCTNLNSAGSIGGEYNIEFGWTESIPANAFYGCTSLTEVELPASVSEIGSYAFYGCTGLNEITIPANVTNLGTYSFYGCTNVENLYFNATAMDNLENSNYVFGNLGTGTDGVTVTVGANATRIPNYLFCPYVNDSGKVSNSPNVTKVVFEEGSVCYRIGSYAFYGCSKLTDIELPDSVTVIGAYAFNGCPINVSNITVSSVGDYAFYGCTSITSVTITGGTTSVGKYAFYGTGLTSVTIPVSVTVIEDYAFGDISALEDVYYGGSEAQWAAIEIGEGNASLTAATIHYNCDVPDTSGEVRYFYKWDAENQIAYFETDPEENPLNFGSQVTEETDTSFLENVDELVGTYVLVKTQVRDDGMLLPDTLISIKPLETYTGVVTAISTTDGTVTIDGTTYAYTFDWLETVPEVGDYVKYRLYEDEIVSLEIVENSSTQAILYFSSWDEENQMVYFGRDVQSMAAVTDDTDTSFLDELDALLGRYVLVDLNVVDGTTELVSIKAVDTNVGTVSAVDATSVTIDGMTYTVDVGVLSGIAVDDYILYHIYEDEIIAVEVLPILSGELMGWTSETRIVSIRVDDSEDGAYSYRLSDLADEATLVLLNAQSSGEVTIVTEIQFACDEQGFIYYVEEAPKDDENINYFNPEIDAWSFRNNYDGFGYANPYRISEDRYEEVFGASYVASAKASFGKVFESMMPEWGGNCYGMSVTAILFYEGLLDWGNYGGNEFNNINDYCTSVTGDPLYAVSAEGSKITNLIERYQVLQYNDNTGYQDVNNTFGDLIPNYYVDGSTDAYENLETCYVHNPGGNYIDTILNKITQSDVPLIISMVGSGGHALVTRTDKKPKLVGDNIWRVYIYDPNHPYFSAEYSGSLESYYSNDTDLYIEFHLGLNQWRYYGSVNGNTSAKYWGSDENWNILAYTKEDGNGNVTTYGPEYCYVCSIHDSGISLTFDGTEKWTHFTDMPGFIPDGYVDIYTEDGILICSVENGTPVYLGDEVEYTPFIGADTATDSSASGKIWIPNNNFIVEYIEADDISFIGSENVINIASTGSVKLYVNMSDGVIEILSNENSEIITQITNVYSNSVYTSIDAEGSLYEGDKAVLKLDDGQCNVSISGKGELAISTDNDEKPEGQSIIVLDESDGTVQIENVRAESPEVHVHSYATPSFYWLEDNTCTATFECVNCDDAQTVNCVVNSYTYPATCTEVGEIVYTATVEFNGETYTDTQTVTIDALSHSYETIITTPTCTEHGYTTHTCTRCADSYVDSYVDATGHSYGDWTETKAATCTEAGEESRTCASCGESETRELEALGHDYESVVTAPTCTEQGYTTHTCTRCTDSYVDSYVDATGHSYGDWTETKAATCTEAGEETRTCAICGESETRELEALGHDYESVVTAPTCTEQGYTTHTCSHCEDSYVDSYVDATGHAYGDWTETKAATCTEAGEESRTCASCGESETREIEALGHDYESVVTAPTCTEQGYTTHTCSRCEDSYVDSCVDATGHAYGDWTETKAATCTEAGEESRTCASCGEFETCEIAALGHSYESVVTEPTESEQGYTTHTCERCGDSYVDSYTDPAGHEHIWDEGVITREATCTENGEITYTCSCGETKAEVISALGHSYEAVITEPTCTEQGYTTHTCSYCGDSYADSYVDATGHTFENGECTECGEKDSGNETGCNWEDVVKDLISKIVSWIIGKFPKP